MNSCVLIIPTALRAAANAVAEAMGWGPDNYSAPLSATGQEPATHYGLHAWASDEFKGWVEGTIPLPMPEAQPVIDALIYSFRPDNNAHWQDVLAEHGLQVVEVVL